MGQGAALGVKQAMGRVPPKWGCVCPPDVGRRAGGGGVKRGCVLSHAAEPRSQTAASSSPAASDGDGCDSPVLPQPTAWAMPMG